jgi:hypothetical protein
VISKYILPLAIEAILLTLFMMGLRYYPNPSTGLPRFELVGLAAFAMGLQNATITKISGNVVRSTHLTGVITDFAIESVQFAIWAWDQLRGRWWQRTGRLLRVSQRHPTFLRVALLGSIIGSFLFGTTVGTLSYGHWGNIALVAPIAFLLFIIVVDWKAPIADIREMDLLADPELALHGLMHNVLPPELGLYRLTHDRHARFRAPNFSLWIGRLPENKRVIILAISPVMQFTSNAILDLQRAIDKLEAADRKLIIAGVTPVQYKRLAHERLVERIGAGYICPDLEFAIAMGAELVRDQAGDKVASLEMAYSNA